MKFFKRVIKLKIKRLDSDQRVLYLANKIIDEVQKSGKCLRSQGKFGSAHIYTHRVDDEDAIIVLESMSNDLHRWEIEGPLTTKLMKAEEF